MTSMPSPIRLRGIGLGLALLAMGALGVLPSARADEAAIRKNLAERLPNLPRIDEVTRTPIPGIYEVRIGTDLLYSDEHGNYVIQGSIVETRTRTDLTQARVDKLMAIDFSSLPLKDALVIRQGSGARKLAVFADPNCGYCKQIERDLLAVKDVTIYTFLYPILGPDSNVKSRDIWCAKDPAKAWRQWMVDGVAPTKVMGACDTAALERNLGFGKKNKVQGTPAVVFEDGSRVPGAMSAPRIEERLAAASKKS